MLAILFLFLSISIYMAFGVGTVWLATKFWGKAPALAGVIGVFTWPLLLFILLACSIPLHILKKLDIIR